ncbi:hypothetical protein ACFL1T_04140 [Chlamydiota bacterium]
MKKIWMHKSNSFKEAEAFDDEYYFRLAPEERLDMLQFLRISHQKMENKNPNCDRRLQKVIKITNQKNI